MFQTQGNTVSGEIEGMIHKEFILETQTIDVHLYSEQLKLMYVTGAKILYIG